ncbi:hypothetical protein GH984_05540, partial [Spiribacter sp. C176]|nr:hypothetical protein [Spiribacter salilacus]
MEGSAALESARVICALRRHAGDLFPINGSNIPLDICLIVSLRYHEGSPLTMKQLVQELPYSEAGIQYNIRMLKDQNWILLRQGTEDKRVRHLIPARKLESALLDFQTRAESTINGEDETENLGLYTNLASYGEHTLHAPGGGGG